MVNILSKLLHLWLWCVVMSACMRPAQQVRFTLLQLNDVYEISPLDNGKVAGMARVAQVRQQLLAEQLPLRTILAGDFVSPSLMGTLADDSGTRLKGKQMVEAMNAAGVDYVVFGNHEFDIDSAALQHRIDESNFVWIASNVKRSNGQPFAKYRNNEVHNFPETLIETFESNGKTVRVGFLGITLPLNKPSHVRYLDVWTTTRRKVAELKPKCDVIVAITHQDIADDKRLAAENPDIALIIGGHDHHNMLYRVGKTLIAKADANAKSVYIHRFRYKPATKRVSIQAELKPITDAIAHEPATEAVVQKWLKFSDAQLSQLGYNPKEVVYTAQEPLDGRESSVRHGSTNLTQLIVRAIAESFPQADAVLLNSGSIRIDDQLHGQITQEDILRAIPFGGRLALVRITGTLLKQVLEVGVHHNLGTGGYLQVHHVEERGGQWFIKNSPLSEEKVYTVVVPEFVIQGKEQNLQFFKVPEAELPERIGQSQNDTRNVVIDYLKGQR